MTRLQTIFKDARNFQITYLSGFLLFGIIQLKWFEYLDAYFVAFSLSILAQSIGSYLVSGKITGLKSSLITALGLCVLLRTNSLSIMALAAIIAIAAKFIVRFKGKHIFNPSHIGIVGVLLLTGSAWISPGQWGNEVLLVFLIIASGSIVLFKVGRLDITYVFLGSLFVLEYMRTILYLGWEMDVLMHKFCSGSLLFFAFFMITDPRTTPDNKRARYFWTIILATLTFFLSQWFYLYTATIWAYLIMTPFTLLSDKYFPSERFEWNKELKNNQRTPIKILNN